MATEIRTFANAEEIAAAFVAKVEARVSEVVALQNKPWRSCKVALSGGSTPKRAYELLSKSDLDRSKLELYMVDERYVPPSDERSNEAMIRKALNDESFQFFPMYSEGGVEHAASEYNRLLRSNVDKFDIVLLGMGDDGHTASIFPDLWPEEKPNTFCVASQAPVVCTDRITLTTRAICWAKETIFMVTGEAKAERLREVLKSKPNLQHLTPNTKYPTPNTQHPAPTAQPLPAQYVSLHSIHCEWWVDEAAARLL